MVWVRRARFPEEGSMGISKPVSIRAASVINAMLLFVGVCGLGTAAGPMALAPQRAGEIEPIDVAAGYSPDTAQERIVWYPDASFLTVHFSRLDLAPGVELSVSDLEEAVVHTYPGAGFTTDGQPGKWALGVPGDTTVIELRVVDPQLSADLSQSGFEIDRIAWEYPLGGGGVPETVCGGDDRQDVECYSSSHPTEFERSHAVAYHRRIMGGVWLCTAWRVGPGDQMFTNHHCLENQSWLDASSFWFNYERTGCNTGVNKPITSVTGDSLLINDFTLDFALFTIDNPAAVQQYGYLELDVRLPVLQEEIYMAGHPDGIPKIFALESDFNAGGLCVIDDVVRDGNGPSTDTGYYCDSSGGQSGSPVLARSSHKVIALHHFGIGGGLPCGGVYMNAGVRIDRIWPFVEDYLSLSYSDGFESGDLSAWSSSYP
jgi:hypothetical protein